MNSTARIVLPSKPARADDLAASAAYCRRLTRKSAKNFYYGLKLTPEPKRSAMYAVYAWMRTADDLADQAGGASEKIKRLEVFRRKTLALTDPVEAARNTADSGHELIWPAVQKAVLDFRIPDCYLQAMIDGQLVDQRRVRYDTFEQLYSYCYQVASVVGLVCITVWGYSGGAQTQKLAEHRGVGLQLTNILRDLVEDAHRDRVYLPGAELQRYGYDSDTLAKQLVSGQVGGSFEDLIADQVDRARHYYDLSAGLEDQIESACRPTSWAIVEIYRRLLEKIARNPRSVLTGTVRLRKVEKLRVALAAAWTRRLGGSSLSSTRR